MILQYLALTKIDKYPLSARPQNKKQTEKIDPAWVNLGSNTNSTAIILLGKGLIRSIIILLQQ